MPMIVAKETIGAAPGEVGVYASRLPRGHEIALHRHDSAQLIFAKQGVMTVTAADGIWIVPPQRAVWMPAGLDHAIRCATRVEMRSLYFGRGQEPMAAGHCMVIQVSPLLRELIVAAVETIPPPERLVHLLGLIGQEVRPLRALSLHLPEPRHPTLCRITRQIRERPDLATSLDAWGREVGASRRTLTRRFIAETGLTFRQWQRQARFHAALSLLAEGEAVGRVAAATGFESASAFASAFRRAFGTSPSRYFRPD